MSEKKDMLLSFPRAFKSPHILAFLEEKAPILVGFSGGADSTALLHLTIRYAKKTGTKIYAAHINHGIRGEEADRDERFCKDFALAHGVELFVLHADIPNEAKRTGESIETAARRIRYEYFDSLMKEHNIPILATAHNANDNIETVIFNLTRGSGLSGMCGIPEARKCKNGIVVRPILGMEKSEIINYCTENSLQFVTDSTNVDTDYTRNKIRSQIIPTLSQINSGAVKNVYRMTQNLCDDASCLDNMAKEFEKKLENSSSADLQKICNLPKAVAQRVIIRLYNRISMDNNLEAVHIDAILTLAHKAVPHSSLSLPNEVEAVIENGQLLFRTKKTLTFDPFCIELCDGKNLILQAGCEIFIGRSHIAKNVYKKEILLSIDFDKINGKLIARNRLAGDKIRMGGMNKSVKKLMCDKKVPIELRNTLPIICDDNGILAIPFLGIRDGAKFEENKSNESSQYNIYFYLK